MSDGEKVRERKGGQGEILRFAQNDSEGLRMTARRAKGSALALTGTAQS